MPVPVKFVVPVALGLSLVTVTAFVVYYVFKKDEEAVPKTVATSRSNCIEVNVPKRIVPALIGRNGSNIKDIENRTATKINFKKFSDKDYDVCIIRGESNNTQIAENQIHEFIRMQPDIMEDTLLVPNWAVGRIIGSGGENINEISHRSGARVKVDGTAADQGAQRTVSLRGTKQQIQEARELIDKCVSQERCRREIEQSTRAPRAASSPAPPASSAAPASTASTAALASPAPEDMPEGGSSTIEVYVSAVSSPSRFWVQFVGPQVAQLDELVNEMTDYYGNADNRQAHQLRSVQPGQVVAAVFRHDGRWYRARVDDVRPNEFDNTKQVADVFFLDYGDSEYVATHELCELRADLLRLRFQAMECFLAGVRPAGRAAQVEAVAPGGARWLRWSSAATERFEQLTQVARWKPLVSKTCTYKKSATEDGQREKEIPGIKLYDVTEEGELDISAVLVKEGHAVAAPPSPRASPPRAQHPAATAQPPQPPPPFGDLGASHVLFVDSAEEGGAAASNGAKRNGIGFGIDQSGQPAISNLGLSYPEPSIKPHVNGSHDFLETEKREESSTTEPLVTHHSPDLSKSPLDELKANINRIDSHHNLEDLGRKHEL